jgi:hypothetical protein
MIKPSLVVALLALCVVMGLGFFLIKEQRPAIKTPEKIGARLIKDASLASTNLIEIKKSGATIKLEKKDKNWVLASHKNRLAKSDRIDQLLADTGSARIEGTRTGAPEKFALDEKNVTELSLSGGDKVTLWLGKSPDYSKAFVRSEKDGPIYEIDKGLDTSAAVRTEKEDRILDPAYFFDLKIIGMSADEIIDIAIKKGNESVRVRRFAGDKAVEPKQDLKDAKTEWRIVEPEALPADDSGVSRVTNQVLSLNMKKYADGVSDADAGFDKPSATAKFVLKDGTEHLLTFGKIDGEDVYLSVNGKEDRYVIYKFTYDNLTLGVGDLKKKPETKDEGEKKSDAHEHTPGDGHVHDEKPAEKKEPAPAPVAPPAAKTEVPPPPPAKVEDQTKPALPPAVVKQPAEEKKVEQK